MDKSEYRSWVDFNKDQYRRSGTFQLSIDELARDLYFDNRPEIDEDEEEELNFDR